MIPPVKRNDKGLLPVLTVSFLFHIAVYGFFSWLHIFPSASFKDAPVYYVDMVNLPVESPQQGSPSAAGNEPASPAPVKPSPPTEMRLPAKDAVKVKPVEKAAKPAISSKQVAEESSKDFEDRLAKLETASDARHEAAAMEALRKKTVVRGKGQAGIPGGVGHESGSDYAGYIRSRLVDAFKTTIAYQEKSPRLIMVLTIDRNGKVIKRRAESSTGDRIFEDAVNRAIVKAEKEFRPPPGGGTFEYGFIFTAQGVGKH
jgi:colicin import membrane protein